MTSSKEKLPAYMEDLEVCRSQDRIKGFYEHCQSKYEAVEHRTTFSSIIDYGISLLAEYLNNDKKDSLILDLGCDLGATGQALQKAGFSRLHGITTNSKSSLLDDKSIYSKVEVLDKDSQSLPFDERIDELKN